MPAAPQRFDGALGSRAQDAFELGEGKPDRIEVGTVGRHEVKGRAYGLDRLGDGFALAPGEIVHDHDIAGRKDWGRRLLDIGGEGLPRSSARRAQKAQRCLRI